MLGQHPGRASEHLVEADDCRRELARRKAAGVKESCTPARLGVAPTWIAVECSPPTKASYFSTGPPGQATPSGSSNVTTRVR